MLAVSSLFLGLLPLIFLLIIPRRFSMGFRSGELAGQSSTVMAWASNQVLVLLAGRGQVLLEDEICISIQVLSRRNHEVL